MIFTQQKRVQSTVCALESLDLLSFACPLARSQFIEQDAVHNKWKLRDVVAANENTRPASLFFFLFLVRPLTHVGIYEPVSRTSY